MNSPGADIGARNRHAVETFFRNHLCATNRECAQALGLSVDAIGRHVKAIRATWLPIEQDSEVKG